MTTTQGILALAASLALAGCASNSGQTDTTGVSNGYQSDTSPTAGTTGLPDNPQVPFNDKMRGSAGHITSADTAFIRDTEGGNQFEISSAQKALAKSSSPQIKDIAQRLSDDHEKANAQLTNLALRLGLPDTSSMSAEQIQQLSKLDSLSGKDFDREYLTQQVQAHKDTVMKFKAAADSADDKDLRDWASATLPTLQNHLTMIKSQADAFNVMPANPGVPDNSPTGNSPSGNSTPDHKDDAGNVPATPRPGGM